jgi:hypothetical protein
MLPKSLLEAARRWIMRVKTIYESRVPLVVIACALGAFASVACGGGDEPGGKVGGGLGSAAKGGTSSGSGGSGAKGSGGSISIGQGGTSGTVGVGGSSGSSGASGTTGSGGSDSCVAIDEGSSKVDLALLFMVDISGSMNCPVPETQTCTVDPNMHYDTTRWTEMSPALQGFFGSITAQDNIWAGISFFSRNRGSCTVSDYEKPDSEIALLPGAAMSLDQAVMKQTPQGSTPTVPALQGALNHANSWAAQHTDQNVVVVYATDGYPQGCDKTNTIDVAAQDAATALAGQYKIHTYVLGVGPNLTDLDKIAASGGTDSALFIDVAGTDVTQQLIDKFNQIRTAATTDCTFTVPAPPAGQTLNGYVNVKANDVVVPFNDTATCDQGWQYNADKTQIILCGTTCDQVKADNASISMAFGCQQTVTVGQPR